MYNYMIRKLTCVCFFNVTIHSDTKKYLSISSNIIFRYFYSEVFYFGLGKESTEFIFLIILSGVR